MMERIVIDSDWTERLETVLPELLMTRSGIRIPENRIFIITNAVWQHSDKPESIPKYDYET
jgi:hypothetical protein